MPAEPHPPPTRWELDTTGERWQIYKERFDTLFADGSDVEGEARLVDAMAPRGADVLDAGCGTGRIAAALHRVGHRSVGIDRDTGLISVARERYPDVQFLAVDILSLNTDLLVRAGAPQSFDIIAVPGNVMVYLAPGTEQRALQVLADLLKPAGRIVTGFATDREYTVARLDADAARVGLAVEHRFSTWHLDPWSDDADWAVTVLRGPK